MSNDGGKSRAPQGQRQAAIDRLMEAFAEDVLDVDEFERRLDRAHAATTSDELQALLSDLPSQSNLPAAPGQAAGSGGQRICQRTGCRDDNRLGPGRWSRTP